MDTVWCGSLLSLTPQPDTATHGAHEVFGQVTPNRREGPYTLAVEEERFWGGKQIKGTAFHHSSAARRFIGKAAETRCSSCAFPGAPAPQHQPRPSQEHGGSDC